MPEEEIGKADSRKGAGFYQECGRPKVRNFLIRFIVEA